MNNVRTQARKRLAVFSVILAVVLIAFDQFTKWLAVERLKDNEAFVLIKGVFELDYLENRGVAFGMFQNQKWPILITGAILMLAIGYILYKLPEGKKYDILMILLVCILAGGVGNMIDRFFLGYVVDFFSFVLINFPIFNVADCYVVCATIGLCIMFLFVMEDKDLDFLSFKNEAKQQEK